MTLGQTQYHAASEIQLHQDCGSSSLIILQIFGETPSDEEVAFKNCHNCRMPHSTPPYAIPSVRGDLQGS